VKPYKVCPWIGDRGANIEDRATGRVVGYVTADYHGRWDAYLDDESAAGSAPHRLRSEAAAAVWAAHTKARV